MTGMCIFRLQQQRQEYDTKFVELCRHSEVEFGINLLATHDAVAAENAELEGEVEVEADPPTEAHRPEQVVLVMSPSEKRIFRQLQERGYGMGTLAVST